MNKLTAIALMGHRDATVRGISAAIVTGAHQSYAILRDALMDAGDLPEDLMRFEPGESYYVETLTKYYVGKVVRCDGCELELTGAAWVSSTGFMTEFMAKGKSEHLEVEIVGDISIPVGIITAKAPWPHKIWKEPVR